MSQRSKFAALLITVFIVLYIGVSFVNVVVFGERTFIEEIIFTGYSQGTIFKIFVLLEFAVFAGLLYSFYVKRIITKQMLWETDQLWATNLASIGDAVIITDDLGKILFMNAEAEELTGWKLSDAQQKHAKEIFKISSRITGIVENDPVTEVLERKQPVCLVSPTNLTHKTGSITPIRCSAAPIKDEDIHIIRVALIFRDITQQTTNQEELTQTKDFCESIIKSITDPVYVIDPNDYRIIFANLAASQSLKLSKTEVIGKTCHELTHHKLTPCEGPLHRCPMKEVLKTGKAITVKHKHAGPDGKQETVEITLYPIMDKDKKITQILHLEKHL